MLRVLSWFGPPLTALRRSKYSRYVDYVMFSLHRTNGPQSSIEARRYISPSGRQTTAVFGRFHQNVVSAGKVCYLRC